MIVPILTYGSLSLYGSAPPHIKSKIEKVEDRAQLMIGNSERIPKAESIKKKQLCTFVHKCNQCQMSWNTYCIFRPCW